ncbi:MAG TPA: hypothetical protein VLB46_15350 [Pyrinomonadaceae bacterium]|nr:hypothetical protein [Pyrinomonadaceae bacterium]
MSFRFSLLLIATAIVLLASAVAPAQSPPTTVSFDAISAKLGDKTVLLPAPDGYEEVSQQWETVKAAFTVMTPREGDLLGAYLQVSDCELIRKGQAPLMPSWLMINIYREARTHVSSKEEFARVVAYARQDSESLLDPNKKDMKEQFARVDEFLTKAYSKEVKLDLSKPKILGVFDNRPNVYSNLLLLKLAVHVDGKDTDHPPMLGTMSLVLVKERLITVLAYKKIESKKDDAEMLTKLTTKWIDEILAAN